MEVPPEKAVVDPNSVIHESLHFLGPLDQIWISEDTEPIEINFESYKKQKYNIMDKRRRSQLFALEDPYMNKTNVKRPFMLKIYDTRRQQVINFIKPLVQSVCSHNNMQEIAVFSPGAVFLGAVKQKWSSWKPSYNVENELKTPIFNIKGPFFLEKYKNSELKNVEYSICDEEGVRKIGRMLKYQKPLESDKKYCRTCVKLKFPVGLSVHHKVLLVAAGFLIEYIDSEAQPQA